MIIIWKVGSTYYVRRLVVVTCWPLMTWCGQARAPPASMGRGNWTNAKPRGATGESVLGLADVGHLSVAAEVVRKYCSC